MKKLLIAILSVGFMFQAAMAKDLNSLVPNMESLTKLETKASNNNFKAKKINSASQANNALIGVWKIENDGLDALFIDVKAFEKTNLGLIFAYDIIIEDGNQFFLFAENQLGYVQKGGIYSFDVPFLGSNANYTMKLDKKAIQAAGQEIFVVSLACEAAESNFECLPADNSASVNQNIVFTLQDFIFQ